MHKLAWDFLRSRLQQKSTWTGIVSFVVGMLGIAIKPEYADAITGVALALTSLVCVAVNERSPVVVPEPTAASGSTYVPAKPASAAGSSGAVRDRFGSGSNV